VRLPIHEWAARATAAALAAELGVPLVDTLIPRVQAGNVPQDR
jgi:hypothetical protein